MKRLLNIVLLLCWCCWLQAEQVLEVSCGEQLTLTAHAAPDYVFVQWSDGNTDSVRTVEATEDAVYIAYFAARCEEYANWPVISLYDWLLMIDVAAINKKGYYISPTHVKWYRIVGEADDMHAVFPLDDEIVADGSYYLTLDRDLKGTGDYYAIVDVSDAKGQLCDGLMRSVIVHYSGNAPSATPVRLKSTMVPAGQTLQLIGLQANETTVVRVYSASGQLIRTYQSEDTQFFFPAESVAGCYQVRVSSPSTNQVLKYIVR